MSLTEHLIVFLSIIVGLGLADLLADLHRLIRARRRVRWNALPLAWAVLTLLMVVNYWWAMYVGTLDLSTVSSAGAFLVPIVHATLLYLVCASVLPEAVPEGNLDLHQAFLDERRYYFTLVGLYLVATWVASIAGSHPTGIALDIVRAAMIALVALAAWRPETWVQWTVIVALGSGMLGRLFTQAAAG